ncbi:hypothetical protein F5148DRAFT_977370, partial [Russula earlei]
YERNKQRAWAEMLGTIILILVGTGVNCQFVLSADVNVSPSPKGSYLGFNIAWCCGPRSTGRLGSCWVSGGHIHPVMCFHLLNWVNTF